MTAPFRIQPQGPVTAYKTYELRAPLASHWRPATCEEVDCDAYRNGWTTKLDVNTELGRQQAEYIRMHSGRAYADITPLNSPLIVLLFRPGQRCFRQHQVPLEREPLYVVRGGDWRGNPTGQVRRHANGDDWVEDFGEHQQRIADQIERG